LRRCSERRATRDSSGPWRGGFWLGRPRRPSAGEAVELVDDVLDVGTVGIEGAAAPGEHVLVLLVGRIDDRGEEFGITPGPAHVLGRAAARCGDELWVESLWVGLADALDPDGVIPAVAKVVEIMNRPGAGTAAFKGRACGSPIRSLS
jgi:hypothetical protein